MRAKYSIIDLPRTVGELRALQPFEIQNWVLEKICVRVNSEKIFDMGVAHYC